jgi:hypothetical protein
MPIREYILCTLLRKLNLFLKKNAMSETIFKIGKVDGKVQVIEAISNTPTTPTPTPTPREAYMSIGFYPDGKSPLRKNFKSLKAFKEEITQYYNHYENTPKAQQSLPLKRTVVVQDDNPLNGEIVKGTLWAISTPI